MTNGHAISRRLICINAIGLLVMLLLVYKTVETNISNTVQNCIEVTLSVLAITAIVGFATASSVVLWYKAFT